MSQSLPVTNPIVGIYYTEAEEKERTELLAKSLELPLVSDVSGYDFLLSYVHGRLSLSMPNNPSQKGLVFAEFVKGSSGYRRKYGGKEMLLKAIGFSQNHPLSILDATGGMGKDSFLMASYGCRVHILERNPVVAALLEDGLQRASAHPDTSEITKRITLSVQDSCTYLKNYDDSGNMYDVIYLDPMYPGRSKSALVKKEMQMFQKLIGTDEDIEQLFKTACKAAGKRVVIKRPKNAPHLERQKPSHSLRGKTTRFDVYMVSGRK